MFEKIKEPCGCEPSTISTPSGYLESLSFCNLHSAAPELLEALKALKHEFERMSNARDWPSYVKAEQAITKATGGSE